FFVQPIAATEHQSTRPFALGFDAAVGADRHTSRASALPVQGVGFWAARAGVEGTIACLGPPGGTVAGAASGKLVNGVFTRAPSSGSSACRASSERLSPCSRASAANCACCWRGSRTARTALLGERRL